MRRSLSSRLFAALFAPWFAFVVAEPVPLHDCPVHSAHAVSGVSALAPDAASHAMMMAHGEMDHAAMQESAPAEHHHGSEHAGHHQCCCLGMSCASAIVALAPAPLPLAWVPVEVVRNVPRPAAIPLAPSGADHVLPFANGPPAARV
jgi:hypothetical protein